MIDRLKQADLTDAEVADLRSKVTMQPGGHPVELEGGPLDGITITSNTDGGESGIIRWCVVTVDGPVMVEYQVEVPGLWRFKGLRWLYGNSGGSK